VKYTAVEGFPGRSNTDNTVICPWETLIDDLPVIPAKAGIR
jgi:hypothetical protein